jgi:hypothetical protein
MIIEPITERSLNAGVHLLATLRYAALSLAVILIALWVTIRGKAFDNPCDSSRECERKNEADGNRNQISIPGTRLVKVSTDQANKPANTPEKPPEPLCTGGVDKWHSLIGGGCAAQPLV